VLNRVPHHEDVWWSGGTAPAFLILALDGGILQKELYKPFQIILLSKFNAEAVI